VTALILAAKAGAGPERWVEPKRTPAEQLWDDICTAKIDHRFIDEYMDYFRQRLKNCTVIHSKDYAPAPTWTELPLDPR
jgi:hypothetical protein